ncbi:MAG: glutamate racemase, partial [Flavobacteriales bacterium]|nr:glutamate racemase [Flavobacteriales bacterium]
MKKNNPIGIFDSGVGGTSIWKEINFLMPNEHTIYLADSKHAPNGEKSKEKIIEFSIKNTEKLIRLNAKIIVVACNTATTNAIDILRQNYTIPIIGIEPAIKPASLNTKTGNIGILATKGTLRSALFSKTSKLFSKNIKIIEVVGEGLVTLIEEGKVNSLEMEKLLESYLSPMILNKVDYLVLGCSHFPYLIPIIKKILPPEVTIIDSGEAVARQTKRVLLKNNLLSESKNSSLKFYSNADLT